MINLIKKNLFTVSYLFLIFTLFLYSFTQVDLGLTLSKWSVWQVLQEFFQRIGYFNRPLSTALFFIIVFSLFVFYLIFLKKANKNGIKIKELIFLIIALTIILVFSYNAFSYDLFNYIFDAKVFTYYHQNPYFQKALDYPADPMLSFMHWTHRTFPYGPSWLGVTVPLSFLGFQLFLPTFFLFKSFIACSFLGTVFFISKILKKVSPKNQVFGTIFFVLNPLVIIESLVSGHNDIVMMFFAIASFYFLIQKKYFFTVIFLFLSIGIKFATLFLLPTFFIILFFQVKKKEIPWNKVWLLSVFSMLMAVLVAGIRTNFQPWYLLMVLPFTAFISNKYFILIPTVIISFFSLLQYAPFLYLGNWNPPIPDILSWMMITSIFLSVLIVIFWYSKSSFLKKR